ncbi:hypothetical protein [Nocardioides terrigena]|uniref:hypothetical protein n=1 Tax=Nocardioides terrigena TaxID=424797 RepID=UPI00131EF38A|nr:hypothetical protein [Nocardioides terrigena]
MAVTDALGVLVLGLVALRTLWVLVHPAAHVASQRPGHWSREADRVLLRLDGRTRT